MANSHFPASMFPSDSPASHSADARQTTFCPAKPRSSCSSSQSCQNLLSLNIFHFWQPALGAPLRPPGKNLQKELESPIIMWDIETGRADLPASPRL
jgi:hypothetical protein